jgi:hypothetical protein
LAAITAIAIRTTITAYSTVVTPFCRLRFASEIRAFRCSQLFRSTSYRFISCCWVIRRLRYRISYPVRGILEQSSKQGLWSDGA